VAVGTGPALLAVAHGSADPRAAAANQRLLRRVASLLPGVDVRLAYLDHAGPSLPSVLASLAGARTVVLPLLLTVGYHSRTDIPALLPAGVPYGPVLGPDPRLADALSDRLAAAGVPRAAPVVLAAAGSSDPDAAADVTAMATLLAVRRGGRVLAAYASAIGPGVGEALAAAGPGAAVASYFLAPGRLPDRVRRQAGDAVVTEPLDDHPSVAALVAERYAALADPNYLAAPLDPTTKSSSAHRPRQVHASRVPLPR